MAKTVFEMLQEIVTISSRVERLAKETDRMDERQDAMNERLIRLEAQFDMALRAASTKRVHHEP